MYDCYEVSSIDLAILMKKIKEREENPPKKRNNILLKLFLIAIFI